MTTDDKVYKPEEINETPFPQEDITAMSVNGEPTGSDIYRPATTPDSGFLRRTIAQETISQTLNTKSKKILGEFQFTPGGAIQIGEYTNGVNGDIRISPSGILARDSAGNTSFALDGETGDATFRGTVKANDFEIAGGGIIATATEGKKSLGGFDSIQEAIDWVNGFGGGEVLLPTGTYSCGKGNINLYSNINLIGQDQEGTVLDFEGTLYGLIATGFNSSNPLRNINISNLKVMRSGNENLGAIYIKNCVDVTITSCNFTNNFSSGGNGSPDIYTLRGTNVHIQNCHSKDSSQFLLASDSVISVAFNVIENATNEGMRILDTSRGTILGNHFTSIAVNGITLTSSSNSLRILSNYFVDIGEHAIEVGSTCSHTVISENVMLDSDSASIFLYVDGAVRIVMNNNVVASNGDTGIYLKNNASRCIMNGNSITDVENGIIISAGSDRNIATSNHLYGCTTPYTNAGSNTTAANNITV